MKPNKAFRKFAAAVAHTPEGASLVVGLVWIQKKGWRVAMNVHTAMLHLGPVEARDLADVYDKKHRSAEYANTRTGLEWVAPELRSLADEVEQKNRDNVMPEGLIDVLPPEGRA